MLAAAPVPTVKTYKGGTMIAGIDRALRAITLSGLTVWVVLVVALHPLRTQDYDISTDPLSYYAVGDLGLLMTVAFVGYGLAHLALAMRVHRQLGLRLGPALLTLVGLCVLASAVFEMDPRNTEPQSTHAFIHNLLGLVAFVVMAVTPLVVAGSLRRVTRGGHLMRASLGFGLGTVAAFLAMPLVFRDQYFGIGQRTFLTIYLGWLIAMTVLVARHGPAGDTATDSPMTSRRSELA
jgi:Protein of unknown function (DUF998)